jgi:hypothetical protein
MKPVIKPMMIVATVLAFVLSACGAKAVPTIDPAQVQASAMAAANTMVAMTQAAIPTETLAPPTVAATDTPQPTPTIPPLPTIAQFLASATPASSSGGDNCKTQLITFSRGERSAFIVINNKTGVTLGFNLYLIKNAFGDCGNWYAPDGIKPHNSIQVTNIPVGCYYASAWTLAGKPDFQNYGYPFCDTIPDKFTINATVDTISFQSY